MRPLDPLAERRLGQIKIAGHRADRLSLVEDKADGLALNSSINCRRGRRFAVSAIGLDIVSTFRKMSTKPDQAHPRRVSAEDVTCVATFNGKGRRGFAFPRLCSTVRVC